MTQNNIDFCTKILKAMANIKRLEILYILQQKEHSVGELEQKIDLSQSALSQHLAVLRNKNLVKTRRSAQTIYYSIGDNRVLQILQLMQHF